MSRTARCECACILALSIPSYRADAAHAPSLPPKPCGLSPCDRGASRRSNAQKKSLRVIDLIKEHLHLTGGRLAVARHIMYHYGNMSSPTVLFVLYHVMQSESPRPAGYGIMTAIGPGLCVGGALVEF